MSLSNVPSIDFISPVITGRMPYFVKHDYPHFASYMSKYFSWLEQDDNFMGIIAKWQYNNDASNEVEPYISAILNDLGWTWQGDTTIQKKVLLEFLRDFYLSRGTERSFRFLFKTLFGADVDIQYPRDRMLVTSAAEYLTSYHVYTTANNKDTAAYNAIMEALNGGYSVFIKGVVSGTTTGIERIQSILAGSRAYFAIQIMPTLDEFVNHEDVTIHYEGHTIVEKLYSVLGVEVSNAGTLATNLEQIDVEGAAISGNIVVSGITAGGVQAVDIVNGGSGYAAGDSIYASYPEQTGFGFYAKVKEVDADGTITKVVVLHRGNGYKMLPELFIKSKGGVGAILIPKSSDIGGVIGTKTIEPYVDFDINTIKVSYKDATFTVKEVPIFEKRFYRGRQGVLGETSTLTDSYRYQQFSYDIISGVLPERYDPIVKDLLHPTGYVRTNVLKVQEHEQEDIQVNVTDKTEQAESDTYIYTLQGEAVNTLDEHHIVAK